MLSGWRMEVTDTPVSFEIRMPACDRPQMLQRAVTSLQAQSYPRWKAIVFDDSTSSDSRDLINSLGDDRFIYVRNSRRLGAAENIDQCFSPIRKVGGDYACLLEDDNFLLPNFLSQIADRVSRKGCELILANQRIYEDGVGLRAPNETTRGDWFSEGEVSPAYLRATLLLMEGLSNGGLVWRLEDRIDLQVGPSVRQAGLQEACRSLSVNAPFLFIREPQAIWTQMPDSKTARASETYRAFGRGMQSIRDYVLDVHGKAVVHLAKPIAAQLGLTARLVESLSYSGHPYLAGELLKGHAALACRAFAKGLAIRLCEKDPCAAFLRSLPARKLGSKAPLAI